MRPEGKEQWQPASNSRSSRINTVSIRMEATPQSSSAKRLHIRGEERQVHSNLDPGRVQHNPCGTPEGLWGQRLPEGGANAAAGAVVANHPTPDHAVPSALHLLLCLHHSPQGSKERSTTTNTHREAEATEKKGKSIPVRRHSREISKQHQPSSTMT